MKLLAKIAIRHLLSKHNFGFISFSTFYSIFGLFIGISSLIIISCVTDGFNETINVNLSSIDGHLRINKHFNQKFDHYDIKYIDSLLSKNNIGLRSYHPYIEKHAIVRNKSFSQGVIVYAISESGLNDIFHLNNYTDKDIQIKNDKYIIVGEKLLNHINAKNNDNIIMFNPENILIENSLSATKFNIVNNFKSNFPEYDKMLAFISLDKAQAFFNLKNMFSGIVLTVNNLKNIDEIKSILKNYLNNNKYLISSWKDRHYNLLNWLNVYDVPIKIIMFFIMIVGILNIAASLWMIVVEKTHEHAVLMSLGMTKKNIFNIIILQGAFIGLSGSFSAILFSFLFLKIQMIFRFITLPSDIYFMNYLPVNISLLPFIIYPIIAFILTIIFSYLPAKYASENNIAHSLSYE